MVKLFKKKQKNISNILDDKPIISLLKQEQEKMDLKDKPGPIIFYPAATKEWFDSIYTYNKVYIKSLVHKDNIVNNLIKSYFNLNLLDVKDKLKFRRRRVKSRRNSVNRIFVSRAEMKHTNNKVIITVYTYNKHKNYFLYKLRKLQKRFILRKLRLQKLFGIYSLPSVERVRKNIPSILNLYLKGLNVQLFKEFFRISINKNLIINIKQEFVSLPKSLQFVYLLKKKSFFLKLKNIMLYWYYNQILTLNKYKFTSLFLNLKGLGLINLLSIIYDKKVELNIVDLKSIHLNSDIFSDSMALKLRNRKNRLLRILKKALTLVKLPYRSIILKSNNVKKNNKQNVLKSIKHKVISGVRLEGSGRLTRRLTASRSIFKFRYKGSIKNLYSSSKSLSSVMLRGCVKSNLQYTLINSKTRNGAFGLKSWISSF